MALKPSRDCTSTLKPLCIIRIPEMIVVLTLFVLGFRQGRISGPSSVQTISQQLPLAVNFLGLQGGGSGGVGGSGSSVSGIIKQLSYQSYQAMGFSSISGSLK